MSAPEYWTQRSSGVRFEVVHYCIDHGLPGWAKLVRVDTGERYIAQTRHLDLYFDREPLPVDDGLLALAEAVGVVGDRLEQTRPTGQQPASEFNVAPFSPFVQVTLSDENLATVLNAWSGGAR